MERKLAAILAVDVVGYSRLMEVDEAATFERLHPPQATVRAEIAASWTRLLLTAFCHTPSAVDVECAVLRAMASKTTASLIVAIDVCAGVHV
jgi:hypothetical protein